MKIAFVTIVIIQFASQVYAQPDCQKIFDQIVNSCSQNDSIGLSAAVKNSVPCMHGSTIKNPLEFANQFVSIRTKTRQWSTPSTIGSAFATSNYEAGDKKAELISGRCDDSKNGVESARNWELGDPDYRKNACTKPVQIDTHSPLSIARFQNQGKAVTFLGITHEHEFNGSTSPDGPLQRQRNGIASAIQQDQPAQLIVEGLPSQLGYMPCMELVHMLSARAPEVDEVTFAEIQAVRHGAAIIGWDPTDREMIDLVDGMSADQKKAIFAGRFSPPESFSGSLLALNKINLQVVLELAPQLNQRQQRFMSKQNLTNYMMSLCSRGDQSFHYLAFGRNETEPFDSSKCTEEVADRIAGKFLTAYREGSGKDLLKADLSKPREMEEFGNTMEGAMDVLRDANLRQVMRAGLEQSKSVMVVGGNGGTPQNGCGHLSYNYEIIARNFRGKGPSSVPCPLNCPP